MEFKKLILLLSISLTITLCSLFGISYGWYAYDTAQTELHATVDSNKPAVIFAQTEYISTNKIMPIYDKDRYRYANKNSFSITLGKNLEEYETGIAISLKNIIIDDALKINNYKYELVENNNVIASGDFSEIGESQNLDLRNMTKLVPESYPYTYTYELYLWLSEDGTNQNNLMNKPFSAKINVDSVIKK